MTSTLPTGRRSPSGLKTGRVPRSDDALAGAYREIRKTTEDLCSELGPEDCALQSMPDASPVKWHLGHTTWFFETFVLERALPGFRPLHPEYSVLFNSYYQSVGARHPRPRRGLLSRPSLQAVRAYRGHVDEQVAGLLRLGRLPDEIASILELGLHHEQQHQELILTDVKHLFSLNPLQPAYRDTLPPRTSREEPLRWQRHAGGLRSVGDDGPGFAFDNEGPRHEFVLRPFEIASRPLTSGEYLAFVQDGGYERAELWQSDGWEVARAEAWTAPLYWTRRDGEWWEFTLSGPRPLAPKSPACHLSWYEADACARWAEARLPTEQEWETAASGIPLDGNFVESGLLHPAPTSGSGGGAPGALFGDVWEWTSSAYGPYPGYRPPAGALGEYNGKFMCNQMVLRGGSCATPGSHIRATYRNFFYPRDRWQFSGLRLARDVP